MPSFSIALQRKQANKKTNQDRAEQRERKSTGRIRTHRHIAQKTPRLFLTLTLIYFEKGPTKQFLL